MKPSMSNDHPGLLTIKGATVVYGVSEKGLLKDFFTVCTAAGNTFRIRIVENENADSLKFQVNYFWHKCVDLVIYRQPWIVGDKSGVSNILQSIKAASHT